MIDHRWKSLFKDVGSILLLAAVLSITYNLVIPKGIPLIHTEVKREAAPDSLLFSSPKQDTMPVVQRGDSLIQQESSPSPATAPAQPLPKTEHRKDSSSTTAQTDHPKPQGVKIITFEQFQRLFEEKQALIIDAREPDEYKVGHVPGAINIPYLSVDDHFPELAAIPRDRLIVIYCNNLMCPLGGWLADFMVQMDFTRLFLFEEGWDYWEREDMPVER